METKANYLVIGSVAVGFVVALFAFVIWLEQWGFGKEQQQYVVVFGGEATPANLKEGAQVMFNGVEVGSVNTIKLSSKNSQQALATISVNADTPIRADSVATEENQGFTGRSYLEISAGSPNAPLLKPKGNETPRIQAKPGGIAAVMKEAPQIAHRVLQVANQASNLIGGGQNQDVSAILKNLRQVTDTLASRHEEIGHMIDNLAQASESVNRAAQQAEGVTKNIQPAANQIADAAKNVNQLVAKTSQPIEQFSQDGLIDFRHFISEARQLVQEMRDVTQRLRENPSAFLLGQGNQGGFQPEK